ncbi:MAG: thioredoxin domain-containing protein [Candidatus Dormibacteraeota bacterium]|uniref:Thioredoxin domain-containing protein n=1 Tax=Candidatus Dormiibacter inghamiae TaxID=3127013 RepID=A0A934KGW9_9BACT|nr:thioredoxin domain-containing protein [Candidatus Dormibacteraeota bacterium]MBJ7605046.1 thioredoxin domain-containing protein [Candidatus Dormibacteraeota bacterium]
MEFHFSPRPNRAAEIEWRPWSEEAFREAQQADKPVLLSISAVWCHWCHVMDETSYSDDRVIGLINREYVPIRVDNDVRPDVNQRYNMGGWPTTAFLTPEGDILTGATYLPPEQMTAALSKLSGYYRDNRTEIAAQVTRGREKAQQAAAISAGKLQPGLVDRILGNVEQAYDAEYGGFGDAPKFPQTDALALLAEQSLLRGEPGLLEMARHTLAQMAGGGTYDHVEGGFFRYSTTRDWSVPHFEKMLEDHAGLLSALALTGQAEILDDAVRYLETVLRDEQTGLYAGSQDADEDYYARDEAGRQELRPPYVDRRVYVAWNCALAVAYLDADARLDRPRLRERALQVLDAVFQRFSDPAGGLLHTDEVGGQLGDQVWGLLACVRAGQRERASQLLGVLRDRYADAELGGYFDHAAVDSTARLAQRQKPLGENAIAALALAEMGESDLARQALESVGALFRQYGLMSAVFARAFDRLGREPVKLSTSSPDLARAALNAYPYAMVEPGEAEVAVICVGTRCLRPASTVAELKERLAKIGSPVG